MDDAKPEERYCYHGIGKAVKEVKQGKIDFKADKFNVHTSIGKELEAEKIMDNAREFMATIQKLKPSSQKVLM